MYYSKSTGGFYTRDIHGVNIPADAVEITEEKYAEMLTAQASGKMIRGNENGNPEAIDPKSILTIEEIRLSKMAKLAAYRYAKETAGINVGGTIIKTDEVSQAKLTGTWATAQINPSISIDWKGANGWTTITKAEIDAIALAVSGHVEECYTNERVHSSAIEALTTIEAIEAYDYTTGWPE